MEGLSDCKLFVLLPTTLVDHSHHKCLVRPNNFEESNLDRRIRLPFAEILVSSSEIFW